ncbi:MAG: hypothetical protein IPM82_29790 [Saprospiraceae bacterium]|nr:hypothetical protein [Saprospiraceae bacterium]
MEEDRLLGVIATVRELMDESIVEKWAFLSNKNDPRTTQLGQYKYTGEWLGAIAVKGVLEMRQIATEIVKARFSALCSMVFSFETTTPDHLLPVEYFQVVKKLWYGIPTNYSLERMAAMMEPSSEKDAFDLDADKRMPGFSVALPALPFHGEVISTALATAKQVSEKWNVQGFYNFAFLGGMVVEGYFRVYFDRNDPAQIANAHAWNEDINKAFEEIGLYPYRLNNQMMPYFFNRPDDSFAKTITAIKQALDPNGIIAPGKYCPIFKANIT